MESHLYSVKAV